MSWGSWVGECCFKILNLPHKSFFLRWFLDSVTCFSPFNSHITSWSFSALSHCCGLSVCVSPKFLCWNPQGNGVRSYDLRGINRSWELWGLRTGFTPCKRPEREPLHFPPCEDTARNWPSAAQKRAFTRTCLCWHLDLGLASHRPVSNIFLLFEFPGLWYFVIAARTDWDTHLEHLWGGPEVIQRPTP